MPNQEDRQSSPVPASPVLESAQALCRMLAQALHRSLVQQEIPLDTDFDLKTHHSILQSYQKALQTLIAIESDIEKRRNEERGGGSSELDLDAARREILGRIAVLRDAGGG